MLLSRKLFCCLLRMSRCQQTRKSRRKRRFRAAGETEIEGGAAVLLADRGKTAMNAEANLRKNLSAFAVLLVSWLEADVSISARLLFWATRRGVSELAWAKPPIPRLR